MSANRYIELSAGPDEIKVVTLENQMPITASEKAVITSNAIAAGLSTTTGLIVEGLWFLTSDVLSGGLGVTMVGGAAAGAISLVGVVSALIAAPVSYLIYRKLLQESEYQVRVLQEEASLREALHEKVFFELLRLRCIYNNSHDFSKQANKLLQDADQEIDRENLIAHVERIYAKNRDKTFSVTWRYGDNLPPILRSVQGDEKETPTLINVMRTATIICHEPARQHLTRSVLTNENIHQHFKPISLPRTQKRHIAIGEGIAAGLGVAGFSLGAGWAFGALVVAAGLAAAIPFVGWALLGVGSLVMGAMFGLGIGLYEQKNIQRKALNDRVKQCNQRLSQAEQQLQSASANLSQLKHVVDTNYEREHDIPQVENTEGLYLYGLLSPRLVRHKPVPVEPVDELYALSFTPRSYTP